MKKMQTRISTLSNALRSIQRSIDASSEMLRLGDEILSWPKEKRKALQNVVDEVVASLQFKLSEIEKLSKQRFIQPRKKKSTKEMEKVEEDE